MRLTRLLQSRMAAAAVLFALVNLVCLALPEEQKVCNEAAIQHSPNEARQQGKWPWWLTRGFLMRAKAPEIALMGSSQMGSAVFTTDAQTLNQIIDCVTHRQASTLEKDIARASGKTVAVYDFAMGGAMVSDAYMYATALFHGKQKPGMIVIGVSPRDFMDNTLEAPCATDPFAFFSPYVPLGRLKDYAFGDVLGRLGWVIDHELPIKRIATIARDFVTAHNQITGNKEITALAEPHKIENPLQAILGSSDEVRPGVWRIGPDIPESCFEDNTREYLRRYQRPKPPIYKQELAFFKAFLSQARQERIPVLVVGMPSLMANRSLLPQSFWQEFHDTVGSLCDQYQAKWIDISDSSDFDIPDYLDTVHLNARGGAKLFAKIALAITSDARFRAATDSNLQSRAFAEKVGDNAGNGTWQ